MRRMSSTRYAEAMGEADKAYDRALNYLEKRDRTEKEVGEKLAGVGFSESAIALTLTRLREAGYVNDRDYAIRYMEALARKGRGRLRISAEMRQKGLPEELVKNTLEDEGLASGERERAKEEARKAWGSIPDKTDRRKAMAKVNRRLVSLGYSYDVIGEAVYALKDTEDDDEEKEEYGEKEENGDY